MAGALPVKRGWLGAGAGAALALLVGLPLAVSALPYLAELTSLDGAALADFARRPGLAQSLGFTLVLAVVAPLLACYTALAVSYYRPRRLLAWLSPFLSIPHLAFAVGLVFLFSPTGWLVRALHALTGGFDTPPDAALLAERSLGTLLCVLVLKEIPFLLLMAQSALTQIPAERYQQVGQTLGHSRRAGWWHLVVPELLARLRLPMAAVIIYTLSVVDLPLLAGPNLPGVWAQRVFQWQGYFAAGAEQAAALGGLVLLVLAAALLWLNRRHERAYASLLRRLPPGGAGRAGAALHGLARAWLPGMALVSLGVMAALLVWSLAEGWFYPRVWPAQLNPAQWRAEWPFLAPLLGQTLSLALASASVGLAGALLCLEWQARRERRWPQWWLLLALLVPQLPLVMGWQYGVSLLHGQPHWGWVFWAHCVFTFPYAYLVLEGDYRRFNRRWLLVGQSLGYAPLVCWCRVLLPILKQPILYAWVIAFAVSVALYLPTQLLGAGRVVTVTTEAVNVGSGGDRRLLGLYAFWQMLLPLAALMLAAVLSTRRRSTHHPTGSPTCSTPD